MKYLRLFLMAALIAGLACFFWWIRRPHAAHGISAATPPPAPPAPVVAVENQPTALVASTPASTRENQAEFAATARMYAAHAPLRTPEVANPDSKTNRQILSTMVAKSLSQPASLPPSFPPGN